MHNKLQFVKSFLQLLQWLLLLLHVAVVLASASGASNKWPPRCRLTVSLNNLFEPFFSNAVGPLWDTASKSAGHMQPVRG